jgi:ankyrin repeat protein
LTASGLLDLELNSISHDEFPSFIDGDLNATPGQDVTDVDHINGIQMSINPFEGASYIASNLLGSDETSISQLGPGGLGIINGFSALSPVWESNDWSIPVQLPTSMIFEQSIPLSIARRSMSSSPLLVSKNTEAIRRGGSVRETDIVKVIIFLLDNNLFQEHKDPTLYKVILEHIGSINTRAWMSAFTGDLNDGNVQETAHKVVRAAIAAENCDLMLMLLRHGLQCPPQMIDELYNYAIHREALGLVQYLMGSMVDLSVYDPYVIDKSGPFPYTNRVSAWDSNSQPTNELGSSLEAACASRNLKLVQILLEANTNVTRVRRRSRNGYMCRNIHPIYAAISGELKASSMHAIRNIPGGRIYDPRMIREIVEALIKSGSDINSFEYDKHVDSYRFVPIIAAIGEGDLTLVRYLLANNAKVHDGSPGQDSLLMLLSKYVCWNAQEVIEVASLLILNGINVNRTTAQHKVLNAYNLAAQVANLDLINLLQEAGAVPRSDLLEYAIDSGNSTFVSSILDSGPIPRNLLKSINKAVMKDMNEIAHKMTAIAQRRGDKWKRTAVSSIDTMDILLDANITPPSMKDIPDLNAAGAEKTQQMRRILKRMLRGFLEDPDPYRASIPKFTSSEERFVAGIIAIADLELFELLLQFDITISSSAMNAAIKQNNIPVLRQLIELFDERYYHVSNEAIEAIFTIEDKTILNKVLELATSDVCLNCGRNNYDEEIEGDAWDQFLGLVAQQDDINMLNTWLDTGHIPDNLRMTAAVLKRQYGMLRAILNKVDQDRYLKRSTNFGQRALKTSVTMGDLKSASMLLSFGINPGVLSERDHRRDFTCDREATLFKGVYSEESALGMAIFQHGAENIDMLPLVLKVVSQMDCIVMRDEGVEYTPLLIAIDGKNLLSARILIESGADINLQSTRKTLRTPLQAACAIGYPEMVGLLLEKGANIHAPAFDRKGGTALQLAAMSGHVGIVLDLLERGADINAPGARINGRTALEAAAEHGRVGVLDLLLDYGVKLNGDGERQYQRALKLAERGGHEKMKYLLECANLGKRVRSVLWDEPDVGRTISGG